MTAALVLVVAVSMAVATAGEPVGNASPSARPALGVWVSGGDLTVDLHDALLAEVVRAIAAQAGVPVTIHGEVDARVTQSFRGVPLDEGIRRLTHGHALAITYSERGRTLAGIWLAGDAARRGPARVSPRAAEPVVSGDVKASAPSGPGEPAFHTSVSIPLSEWIGQIDALAEQAGRGDGTAMAALRDLSATEQSTAIRLQAVAALSRLRGEEVEHALTDALSADDPAIRARAVRGLRGTGTDTAVASLARASADDADPGVRLAALNALMFFPGHAMVQGLVRAAADPDGRVRDAAFRGLTTGDRGQALTSEHLC